MAEFMPRSPCLYEPQTQACAPEPSERPHSAQPPVQAPEATSPARCQPVHEIFVCLAAHWAF